VVAAYGGGFKREPCRVSVDGRGIGLSITAESAARFLLEQVSSDRYLREAPRISN